MASLTDHIEEYIKKLLAISTRNYVEIQRADLARKFSPERGYLVESRRGGGGYIRIYRIVHPQAETWKDAFREMLAGPFEPARAKQFLKRILEEKVLSRREARMMSILLQEEHYRGLSREESRELQKRLFQASMEAILKSSY